MGYFLCLCLFLWQKKSLRVGGAPSFPLEMELVQLGVQTLPVSPSNTLRPLHHSSVCSLQSRDPGRNWQRAAVGNQSREHLLLKIFYRHGREIIVENVCGWDGFCCTFKSGFQLSFVKEPPTWTSICLVFFGFCGSPILADLCSSALEMQQGMVWFAVVDQVHLTVFLHVIFLVFNTITLEF